MRQLAENSFPLIKLAQNGILVGSLYVSKRLFPVATGIGTVDAAEIREHLSNPIRLRQSSRHPEHRQTRISVFSYRVRVGDILSRKPVRPLRCCVEYVLHNWNQCRPFLRVSGNNRLHQNKKIR